MTNPVWNHNAIRFLIEPSIVAGLTLQARGRTANPRPVAGWCLAYTRLRLEITEPLGRAILDLHSPSPDWPDCQGCEGGYDEAARWPCSTVELLAAHYDLGPLL